MKAVFFGTPQFAVRPLIELSTSRHEVLAVVTQPDRAKNRKGEYVEGPVKSKAKELGLNILQFQSVKKDGVETLKNLNADIFISAGYGQLFSQEIISIAPRGIINIHASLLPYYRGSSPIQWAIINGESVTGVTIMQTDIGLDTGDILCAKECLITPNETTATLSEKLSCLGATLLLEALDKIESGTIKPVKQDHSKATKFPLITKETGKLDFNKSAVALCNMIRAIDCHTYIGGKYIKVLQASAVAVVEGFKAGQICSLSDGIAVCCNEGALNIKRLQPENKKPMTAKEFLSGHKIDLGMIIG